MGINTDWPMKLKPIRLAMLSKPVMISTGTMTIRPPMVGVPIFIWCDPGSSTRIFLPISLRISHRMRGGPQITARKKVIAPSASG